MSAPEACRRCGAMARSKSEVELCQACLMELGLARGLEAGTRLGPYEILGPIGAGGMGEVYRARDDRLKREVAIKVLPVSFSADPDRLLRFEREAQSASALNHPNIIAVHDVGSYEGSPYIVSELLEGRTLREALNAGALPPRKAMEYAAQIARGLSAAHAKGIVHRDLKPENVFLTREEHVKILDFGVASSPPPEAGARERASLTQPGVILGTLSYMSPEQVRGQAVDVRSDIFSFGAILYEMLSGRQAFGRDSAAETMSAILKEEPPELSESGRSAPAGLEHILRHCLEKDPQNRFQSASDIAFNLSEPASPVVPSVSRRAASPAGNRRMAVGAAAVAVVALAVAGGFLARHARRSAQPKRIAVLPFENLGAPEDGYFADGIADEVRGKLTSLPGLKVIARGSSMPYKGTTKTPAEIARELGVGYLLTATVRWQKGGEGTSRVEVSTELVEVPESGTPTERWQQPFDAALTDVFQVQADIATRVAQALDVALGVSKEKRLSEKPTQDMAAYDAFLKGDELWHEASSDAASVRKMLAFYEQAVERDPGFARAWARISQSNSRLFTYAIPTPELAERARRAAERARANAPDGPEGYLALGGYELYVAGDPGRALEQFEKGRRIAPGDADLLTAAAFAERALGRWGAAVEHLRQAVSLDPVSASSLDDLGGALFYLRRYPEAREAYDRGLALAPAKLDLIADKAATYLIVGDLAGARSVLAAATNAVEPAALVAFMAYAGDFVWVLDEPQRELLLRLTPSAFDDDRGVWGLCLAQAYALKGDSGNVRTYAEEARKAFEEQVGAAPADAQRRVCLGLALAYLGRKEEAIREGERGVALDPVSKNAENGPYYQHQLVRIYTLLGEPDKALDHLEPLLKIPSWISPGLLRIDPNFDPLRGNPRFQKLVASGE